MPNYSQTLNYDLVHAGPVCVQVLLPGLDISLVADRVLILFPVPF